MSSLPDRKRPQTPQSARALAASLAQVVPGVAWRVMNPRVREPFVESPAPVPLARVPYHTDDGWRACVRVLSPCPGGAGEPVLLAHPLGVDGDSFRYGGGLAAVLSAAGFAVYLLTHRGDRDALGPQHSARWDIDDIVEHDLSAAIRVTRRHAGFPRVHLVGHGFGGQLALMHAGRFHSRQLATVTALAAPMRIARTPAGLAPLWRVASVLPAHWRLPSRRLAQLASLGDALSDLAPGSSGPRLRGVLRHLADDLPLPFLEQLGRWADAGGPVDRTGTLDYLEAVADARIPLLAAACGDDAVCPPSALRPVLERWGHADQTWLDLPAHWGHLDPLLASDAAEVLHKPLAAWLHERRRLAWTDGREQPRAAG